MVVFGCHWRGLWLASLLLEIKRHRHWRPTKPPPVAPRDPFAFRKSVQNRKTLGYPAAAFQIGRRRDHLVPRRYNYGPESKMKGPGMRLDLDVRRVWRCPACGRESRAEGKEVGRTCNCTKEGVAMRLVELPRPKPVYRIPDPDPDDHPFEDFPTDIPVNPPAKHPPAVDPETLLRNEPIDEEPESPTAEDDPCKS
jgi:hypothetical protein